MARFSYRRFLAKLRRDPAFRRRLVKNPRKVLKEAGVHIPAGMRIKVLQNTPRMAYIVIPGRGKIGNVTTPCAWV